MAVGIGHTEERCPKELLMSCYYNQVGDDKATSVTVTTLPSNQVTKEGRGFVMPSSEDLQGWILPLAPELRVSSPTRQSAWLVLERKRRASQKEAKRIPTIYGATCCCSPTGNSHDGVQLAQICFSM